MHWCTIISEIRKFKQRNMMNNFYFLFDTHPMVKMKQCNDYDDTYVHMSKLLESSNYNFNVKKGQLAVPCAGHPAM